MHQVLAVENIEKPVKRGRQAVELGISGFLSTIQRACPILGRIPPFLNNNNTPNQTHRTESSKHSLATKHQAAYVTDLNQPITMPDAIMCFQTRTDCFSSKTQSCKIQTGWILEQNVKVNNPDGGDPDDPGQRELKSPAFDSLCWVVISPTPSWQ